jgi:hypothetical protein
MPLLPRLLAPLTVAAAMAAVAPAAHADPSVTFPEGGVPATTVEMTDAGAASDTVRLTVTAADADDLVKTKVFLGGDTTTPYHAIGVDGVHDARYADSADGELSTGTCAIYDGSRIEEGVAVTVSGDGRSFSADLPKGEVIAFEDTGVDVGVIGTDPACESQGFHGLEVDYLDHQTIDGFTWAAPAAPVVGVTGGRRQVALSFDQARGTKYDIFREGDATPWAENVRGNGDDVQVVLTEGPDGQPLTPGTNYAFRVQATRLFNVWQGDDMIQLTGPPSAVASATTAAVQTVRFTAAPPAATSERTARFSWSIDANDAGEAPWCVLDRTEMSGTEVPCTAAGATIDGLAAGPHTLTVYPADGEAVFSHAWTVTAPAAPPAAPAAAPAPVAAPVARIADPDGDGIKNTWIVGGKPARAPGAPKARSAGRTVTLTIGSLPGRAAKLRVYRAEGRGRYKLVKTLSAKARAFTDKGVKPGRTYSYKTLGVNAKGQQGAASRKATVKVGKAG